MSAEVPSSANGADPAIKTFADLCMLLVQQCISAEDPDLRRNVDADAATDNSVVYARVGEKLLAAYREQGGLAGVNKVYASLVTSQYAKQDRLDEFILEMVNPEHMHSAVTYWDHHPFLTLPLLKMRRAEIAEAEKYHEKRALASDEAHDSASSAKRVMVDDDPPSE